MPFCLSKHTFPRGSDLGGFPGGPAVKNLPSDAGDMHLILGKETKIPHTSGQLSHELQLLSPRALVRVPQ